MIDLPKCIEIDVDGGAYRWMHYHRDDPDAQRQLAQNAADLGDEQLSALLADDTRPRCTPFDNGVLLNLRGVNLNPGQDPEDMVSVRLWIDAARVIGVWLRPLAAVGDLYVETQKGRGPNSTGGFAEQLAERLITRMEPIVATLSDRIDTLEERVIDARGATTRGDLAETRRMAIILRRYIAPQREALATLAAQQNDWLSAEDKTGLRESFDRTTRLVEDLDALRERAAVIHDQLADKRAAEMNRSMLVLAVVAAIFLPLGLLTGLLGINVGGIPLADSPFGFALVTGLLFVLGGAQYWLYRRWNLL
ncbi:MAG: zinc transporter ZntB [Pseudomonadota bacterium]